MRQLGYRGGAMVDEARGTQAFSWVRVPPHETCGVAHQSLPEPAKIREASLASAPNFSGSSVMKSASPSA